MAATISCSGRESLLYEASVDHTTRSENGVHYTGRTDILRVINPLFMDGLRARARAADSPAGLSKIRDALPRMRILDPACGTGNFLAVAASELSGFESELTGMIGDGAPSGLSAAQFSGIDVDGGALRVAARAVEGALHRAADGAGARLLCGDALRADWGPMIAGGDPAYIIGNPPFRGARRMSPGQMEQTAGITGSGILDYAANWLVLASRHPADFAFVSTNSIVQGQQVEALWPPLLRTRRISFAYDTFKWGGDGGASVSVVIVGMTRIRNGGQCRLFRREEPGGGFAESNPPVITPYLKAADTRVEASVIRSSPVPTNGLPPACIGSMLIDEGHYTFNRDERDKFLKKEPGAADFMVPYVGAREIINRRPDASGRCRNGLNRWVLRLHDASPRAIEAMPLVRERIEAVKRCRTASRNGATRMLANTPQTYHGNVFPKSEYIAIPKTSSERREYIPIMLLNPPEIPNSGIIVIEGSATRGLFGLLASKMHMAWLRHAGGRLNSSLRYSAGMVYNTFPVPAAGCHESLSVPAGKVLAARAAHPGKSIADLYDPAGMPENLRQAHAGLDAAVDALYGGPFAADGDRLSMLLRMYNSGEGAAHTLEQYITGRMQGLKMPACRR